MGFAIHPIEANAMERNSCPNGCSLYYWDGDSVRPVNLPSSLKNAKFTDMGTGRDYSVMVTDSTGKHWQLSQSNSDSTIANVNAVEISYGPNHPTPLALISGLSERSVICGTFRGASTVIPCTPVSTTSTTPLMSIDASGQVWIETSAGAPYQIQDNTKMDFYAMAIGQAVTEGGYREYGYIYLLAQPRKQDSQTIINQMPTTGAPEGLTTVGMLALTVSLAGLAVSLARRRS